MNCDWILDLGSLMVRKCSLSVRNWFLSSKLPSQNLSNIRPKMHCIGEFMRFAGVNCLADGKTGVNVGYFCALARRLQYGYQEKANSQHN